MKQFFKIIIPHAVAVVIFLIISFAYFSPEIFQNKTVVGHDSRTGAGQDLREHRMKTGERSYWSDAMFSGMPSYQVSPSYASSDTFSVARKVLGLSLPVPASYVFVMMLGFYIMLCIFGARTDIAVVGAVGYAFSSYFFILIEAGHIWKLLTLAYIPPTIAGIALIYKGKFWLGGIVAAFFLALQILSNHVQMTYYSLFIVAAYIIYEFFHHYKRNLLPRFAKATGVLCIAAALAVAINASNLYHTWQYGKQSMRAGSELAQETKSSDADNAGKDWLLGWSYGIGETWTLLIPNAKGGASGYLGNNDRINQVDGRYIQYVAQMDSYWGDQPMTSGPVYAGAFLVALFVLGMFLLKTRLKWFMLAALILTIMLSWGKNMMWFTDVFLNWMPMYSKFRAVSSILIVAEFIIPFMAALMLIEIVRNPDIITKNIKKTIAAFALTGGFAIIFAFAPGIFFDFLKDAEANVFLPQAQQNADAAGIVNALINLRKDIFISDAWRTVVIIAVGGLFLWLFIKNKINSAIFIILVGLLCIGDMWSVNKRYLNSQSFISTRQMKNRDLLFPQTAADAAILADKDINYRVCNLTVSTFNDASTSYYHKSVGGYSAAKLSRYDDLITNHLKQNNMHVFNMLNTKYFITFEPGKDGDNQNKNPQKIAQRNPDALGAAWFVNNIAWAENAVEENEMLKTFNPATTAIIDKRFADKLSDKKIATDSTSSISITSDNLDVLKYKSTSAVDGFAVFSEIYYAPGWQATIDGTPADIVRVNYVLRGMFVPAGNHEIIFSFKPQSVKTTETIAYVGMILLLIAFAAYIVNAIRKKRAKV